MNTLPQKKSLRVLRTIDAIGVASHPSRAILLLLAIISGSDSQALTITLDVIEHSICGRPTGVIAVLPNGVPPYTYEWNTSQTEQIIGDLPAGTYSVTVHDSSGESASGSGIIQDLTSYPAGYLNADQVPMSYCAGELPRVAVWHGVTNGQSPPPEGHYGPMPYSFDHPVLVDVLTYASACNEPNHDWFQLLVFNTAPGQGVVVDYQDGDGCPGQLSVFLEQPIDWPSILVENITGTCSIGAAGSVTVTVGPQAQNNEHDFMIYVRPVDDLTSCPSYGGLPSTIIEYPATGYSSTHTITGLSGGDHWLVWTTDPLSLQSNNPAPWEACKDSVLINVPLITTNCGTVSGTFFVDTSGNCLPGSGEPRVPQGVIEILPGPYYTTTNLNGTYSIPLPSGDYTFTELHPLLEQSCPGNVTVANTGNQTLNIACSPLGIMDVQIGLGSASARPGFLIPITASVKNLTPDPTGALTVTMEVDPLFSVVSTQPTATSVVGNTITWTDPEIVINNAWGTAYAQAWVQVPPDAGLIGTTVTHSASVTTQNTDADLLNNETTIQQVITGSFDPNDKTANTSTGGTTTWTIDEDEWIDYLIRFQNTGTDTAFNVVITDTLPSSLDPSSIEWGAASHSHVRYLQGQGVIRSVFQNILLPDSNVNEAASHGWISFRIRPRLPILPGTAIENIANIYFDYNDPVITDPCVLTAEFSTGITGNTMPTGLRLSPVPVSDVLHFTSGQELTGVQVIAADGRLVLSTPVHGLSGNIRVSELKAGTYLILGLRNDGSTARQRFVKQ